MKKTGGTYYKYDLFTLGLIFIEREFNLFQEINLDSDIGAFLHTNDFISINNIWNSSNSMSYVKKEDVKDHTNYLKEILKNNCEKFLDIIPILDLDKLKELSKSKLEDLSEDEIKDLYDTLIKNILLISDNIIYDDFKKSKNLIEFKKGNETTLEFIKNIKSLIKNDSRYINDLKKTSIDDSVMSYNEIENYYNSNDYFSIFNYYNYRFNQLTIIIGFCALLRFSGLFTSKQDNYYIINDIPHCFKFADLEKIKKREKNPKFINVFLYNLLENNDEDKDEIQLNWQHNIYKIMAKILLDIIKIIIKICNDSSSIKSPVKKSEKSPKTEKSYKTKKSPEAGMSPKTEKSPKTDKTPVKKTTRQLAMEANMVKKNLHEGGGGLCKKSKSKKVKTTKTKKTSKKVKSLKTKSG